MIPDVFTPLQPTRRYHYVDSGPEIYVDSFATIRREADLGAVPASAERTVVRMIHGSGQVDLAGDVVVDERCVPAARAALEAGAPILCDATMVVRGVTRSRLPADNEVLCFLDDPRVPGLASVWGTTRTAAAVSLWEPHLAGAVVAIGNAPTALFHLLELLVDGAPRPAAIVGCPVGFIGAAESKLALEQFAETSGIDIPFITVRGRRGGSAMTSSALNAIAQEVE
ncbi:MAG: precorrin-8X methylmutase [Nocardioides sp.]|uniref:precorrin-8X methylmutase n=1 Tax=Nocardioides sp. TaxID=35761 RepID=UPI003EFE7FC2